MHTTAHTIVIGGGICGLAVAHRLQQLGVPVLLLEQAGRVGGVIDTVEQDGFLFELGPQSFLSNDALLALIDSLGLSGELLRADPRAPRYVLAGGRLQRVPLSPPELLTTSLLSAGTKWRLLSEPFRKSSPPEADESIADFVRRKFGNELLQNLAAPFVSGVYAGDPEKISLRSAFPSAYQWEKEYGGVLRGAMKARPPKGKPRPTLCSFRRGVATLARTLGRQLADSLRCGAAVVSVARRESNGKSRFELEVSSHGRIERLAAEAVVVATPTQAAGQLLYGISEKFSGRFARIEYAPVAVVAAGYRREQVGYPTEGFGFLVARAEKRRVLGTVWNSSLFPGRVPKDMVALTSFAGGATDPDLCELSEEQIAETVLGEVSSVLRINGPPVSRLVWRHPRALPQYNLGHSQTIAALRELCAGVPGLFLVGNYLEGVALGACVEQAFRTAEAVRDYLVAAEGAGSPREFNRSAASTSP